ncbi:hypothetical protein [Paenibacillus odorifer]|uniref:hypothetical protein n=1 Tax=Paenibacillus odorifer TaxID=189426 RepID=UPI00117CDEC7|nr:hypothetical protein [Paenibacillus odorifer]
MGRVIEMNEYDELIEKLGSKVETRDRLQLQINLLLANVAELTDEIEQLNEKIEEFEEKNEGNY